MEGEKKRGEYTLCLCLHDSIDAQSSILRTLVR